MSQAADIVVVIREDFQDAIDRYLSQFRIRANGFTLPKVTYNHTFEKEYFHSVPVFYIGIPVKNQELIISQVLEHLMKRLTSPTEIGLLFDNCTDQSFQRASDILRSEMCKYENLIRVHFLQSEYELSESTCENLLFKLSNAKYLVSFQADIFLLDETFFERSQKAFSKIENLLGISGRATVPLMPTNSIRMRMTSWLSIGNLLAALLPRFFHKRHLGPFLKGFSYFGDTSGYPTPIMNFSQSQINTVYIGQALIRGPIVWSEAKFRELGGFNDVTYFLGRDDCNLALEGSKNKYKVGYLPCEQISNPENGTTRKARTPRAQLSLQERLNLSKSHPGELDVFWKLPYLKRRNFLKSLKFGQIRI